MSSSELIEALDDYVANSERFNKHVLIGAAKTQLTTLEQRVKELEQQLDYANKASGFCKKHLPNGGARNCLVCGCEKLSFALDKISYICGEPNEHGLSEYGNHFDEEIVIKQVTAIILSLGAKDKALRAMRVAYSKDRCTMNTDACCMIAINANMMADNALSTTPNDLWQSVVETLRQSISAAEYVTKIVEADCKAGESPNPFEKSMPHATLAHCYAAMAFVNQQRELLTLLGATK